MQSLFSSRQTPAGQPSEAPLRVGGDDYSVKVETEADKLFWIRVERTDDHRALITDYIQGEMSEADLLSGLLLALGEAGASRRPEIVFENIVPRTPDRALYGIRLQQMSEKLRRACNAVASATDRSVTRFEIRARGEKMDVVAQLG
ncbi:hypothetical protein [Mangrovibrevibacter kandeliae]|uniref:hypothetical protein n=1 Tax=Mangrovibrevibacter kandeliae TaxID=2968473 RepID=UPI002119146C|nr:hypothetical protein [Aurantimonas sp. CSK15Z-1]MCQ8782273.1 hypothetical protein [Aurantimonas sp. CSK15Z-1]